MRTPSIFVDDGYWLPGEVAELPGLHPGLRFDYRPVTGPERRAYLAMGSDAAAAFLLDRARQFLPTVRGVPQGQPLTLAVEQAKRLHANLYNGIADFVLGFSGPSQQDREKNSSAE